MLNRVAGRRSAAVARAMHVFRAMAFPLEARATLIPWTLNGFRIAAECRPAGVVGGDFYVITAREGERLAVVIGDACGRGRAGAALLPDLLPRVRDLLRSDARPARVIGELNRCAARALPIDRFVTAAALELDLDLCTLSMANAGHVPAVVRSARANVRVVGRASGPPLGVAQNAAYFEECVPLGVGDTVVLMTDGVLEAVETDLCRMPTLIELVAAAPAGPRAINERILNALGRRGLGQSLDDVTLLCLEAGPSARGNAAYLRHAS